MYNIFMLNRKLIKNHKLNVKNLEEFRNIVRDEVKDVQFVGFRKWLVSTGNILSSIAGILLGSSIVVLGNIFNPGGGFGYFVRISGFLIGIYSIVSLILYFTSKNKYTKQATNNFEWLKVTKKYFSYFEIDPKKVKSSPGVEIKEYQNIIATYKNAPPNAWIDKWYGGTTITHKGITSSFYYVIWKWEDYTEKRKQTLYLKQFYIIQHGFNESWNKFNLFLSRSPQLFKNKKENLENVEFNKRFKYKYSDPIKLRKIFTPYTQEYLLENWKNSGVKLNKYRNYVITTVDQNKVSRNFTPFVLNVGNSSDIKKIKKNVVDDIVSDFDYLMQMLAYPYMLENLFKK